ncbi:helix-turn-helix domain-containing protein [Paenibacillus sp. FSL R10-2734]|uniref:helix-turn-helix domain-containing protein n=1 Tax=Paenibacillus sp. FSL R10-2734 TaxID=2954691 RepID=UPI0030D89276
MSTADLIEAIRADIREGLREEILSELQSEIQQRLYSNIFDVFEACSYLKISDSTIRRMVRDKEIPYFRQRGNLYFRQISLDSWVASKELTHDH